MIRRALALLAILLVAASAGAGKPRRTCRLVVQNRSPYRAQIHIDGVYWGWVNPQQGFTFTGVPEGKILVYGSTPNAEAYWGPKALKCDAQASWDLAF